MWMKDPKDNKASVSLTILVVSLLLLVGFGVANVLGKTDSMGPFTELFYSSVALYFGRRININGKSFASDQASEVVGDIKQITNNNNNGSN